MANLSIRRLDDDVYRRLKVRARVESASMEEVARRILREALTSKKPLGTAIQEAVGPKGLVVEIPSRKALRPREPIDFSAPEYGPDE